MESAQGLPRFVLRPDPRSAWQARRLAADALAGHAEGDTLHNALLVVSELVSNAVSHAGTPVSVGIKVASDGVVRIEVGDGRTWPPRPRQVSPESVGGRGLLLVEALSNRWGVETRGDGKVVWAEIAVVDAASRAASRAEANASDPAGPSGSDDLIGRSGGG